MPRFLGYHERPPYLWWVDTEQGEVEPAAHLRDIPQGIDDVVPLDSAVAMRCGLHWLGLPPDLSGEPWELSAEEEAAALRRSHQVRVRSDRVPVAHLTWDDNALEIRHPKIRYWQTFATTSPNRQLIALAGSTKTWSPPPKTLVEAFAKPYQAESASALAIVNTQGGDVQLCSGRFDNFCYPPAWSATGSTIAFGAPFEHGCLYEVSLTDRVLRRIQFTTDPPMPLLDAELLPRG
jgi:hypothetical protein